MDLCRACLSCDKKLMPFDETFISGYNLLTNLNIKFFDGLPQCACETCINTVNCFIDFREQSVQSESILQQQLLKNIKWDPEEFRNTQVSPEEFQSTQVSPESCSEENCDSPPKQERLPKRQRGQPRKSLVASEPKKLVVSEPKKRGRPRKNKTIKAEVEKTVLPSFEIYSNSEELLHSQYNQNGDSDFFKEEIEYQYLEVLDEDLDLDEKLEELAIEPSRSDSPPTKCVANLLEERTPKKSKGTKKFLENDTDFPCGLCEKVFETQQLASSHVEEHKNDSKCETCHAPFFEWQALVAHRIKHVPKNYQQCHICLKRIHTVESLEYHYLTKHSDKKLQDIKLSCKICMKPFSTPRSLKSHLNGVHSTKKYICDHCNRVCHSRTIMKIHLRQHTEVKKYVCSVCGDAFKQSSSLKTHIWRKHTTTSVYCPCCHRVFPNDETLKKHVCPQSEKICPICGKVVKRADRLNQHMATHSNVRKYKCDECPTEFKSRAACRAHVRRHRGAPPHACAHCPKRFYTPCLLIRHKLVHTGVRPYKCKLCRKGFSTNYDLKYHMRVHGQYLVAGRRKRKPSEE